MSVGDRRWNPAGSVSAALVASVLCMGLLAAPAGVHAQITPESAAILLAPDSTNQVTITPRGAMLRSFVVPGWGQAAAGSYFRGGVWFSVEAGSLYMLLRTIGRLNQIEETEARVVAIVTDSLLGAITAENTLRRKVLANGNETSSRFSVDGELDPDLIADYIDSHPTVATARKLVDARRQQRQDWITYTLFFTLLSGVDAYVNAHLKDFPTSIASEVRRDGSLGFSVRVALPRWAGGMARSSAATAAAHPRRW